MNPADASAHCAYDILRVVTLRMGHHAGPSGYDRLAEVLTPNVILTRPIRSFRQRIIAKAFSSVVANSGTSWYSRSSFLTELQAAALWLKSERQIFHFLYGENSFRYLHNIKKLSRKENWLVATFHTPDWKFREKMNYTKHIDALDGVIAVSTAQLPLLEELAPGRVHFVPHGIDTQFFHPAAEKDTSGVLRFLMVGSHLRDFDLAYQAMQKIASRYPQAAFDIVAREERLAPFRMLPSVTCHNGVSDNQLLELYQRAHALFLPLLDSTANNTLLEGMACGLPVITTDLVGTRDYAAQDATLWIEKGDLDGTIDALANVCERPFEPHVRERSRQHALRFDWSEVGAQLKQAYNKITCHKMNTGDER